VVTEVAAILDALVDCAPPVIASVATARARCIAATMTGLRVLDYFGVEAEPRPVWIECYNPAWVAWAREHPGAGPPSEADHAELAGRGGKVLAIGPQALTPDGWPGHLIIAAGALAVDLDAQQFTRQDAGIALPPAIAFAWPEYPEPVAYKIDGCVLIYRPLDNDGWRTGVDVKRAGDHVFRWVAGQIIRAMRHQLAGTPATSAPFAEVDPA